MLTGTAGYDNASQFVYIKARETRARHDLMSIPLPGEHVDITKPRAPRKTWATRKLELARKISKQIKLKEVKRG